MKNFPIVILGLIMLTFISSSCCKKEEIPAEPAEEWHGHGDVYRNTEHITLKCKSVMSQIYHNKFTLVFFHFNERGARIGDIFFRHIPFQEGVFTPSQIQIPPTFEPEIDSLFASDYLTFIRGDIIGDPFRLIDTSTNFFSIDSLNPVTKEVTGRFSVMMRRDTTIWGEQDTTAPDFIHFSSGQYHAKVEE